MTSQFDMRVVPGPALQKARTLEAVEAIFDEAGSDAEIQEETTFPDPELGLVSGAYIVVRLIPVPTLFGGWMFDGSRLGCKCSLSTFSILCHSRPRTHQ